MRVPEDLYRYLESTGRFENLRPARRGDELVASCPFAAERHGGGVDRHPSFGINARSGAWHCFSCDAGGSFGELVEELGLPRLLGMDEGAGDEDARRRIQAIRERVGGASEARAGTHFPLPASYRIFRPGQDDESAGYASRIGLTWDSIRERGVGYCAETGALIYPIPDEAGRQASWQRRNLPGRDWVPYFWPEGFDKTLFVYWIHGMPVDAAPVVVESIKSSILLCQRGIPAVSVLNADVSIEQVRLLGRARELTVMMDGDPAGRRAQARASALLARYYPGVAHVAELPLRADPDDRRTSPDDYDPAVVERALSERRPVSVLSDRVAEIRKKIDSLGGR